MPDSVCTVINTDTDQFLQLISQYGIHRRVCHLKDGKCNSTDIYVGKVLEKGDPVMYPCFSLSIYCKEVMPNGEEGEEFHALITDILAKCFDKLQVQIGDYVAFKGIKRFCGIETNLLLMEPHKEAKLLACLQQKRLHPRSTQPEILVPCHQEEQDSATSVNWNFERLHPRSTQPEILVPCHQEEQDSATSVNWNFEPLRLRSSQPEIPVPCHQEEQDSETCDNWNFESQSQRSKQQKMPFPFVLSQADTETDINCESEDIPRNVVKELISWLSLPTTKIKNEKVTKLQHVTGDCNLTIVCKVLDTSQVDSRIRLLKLTDGTTVTSPVLILNVDKCLAVRNKADNNVHVFVNKFSTCIEALEVNDKVKIQNIQVKSFVIDIPDNNLSTWCLAFKLSGNNTRITECNYKERKSLLKLLKHEPENTLDISIFNEAETNIQCGARFTTAREVPVRPSTSSSDDCSFDKIQKILKHQFTYTVKAWIKHFNPVSTSEFIKLVCVSCKGYESISDINDIKEKCEKCHSKGKTSSKLKIQFFVSLFLQDIKGNTIETVVCGDKAQKFFGCSTAEFLKSKSLQNDINNTLKALIKKCNQKDLSGMAPVELRPVLSASENFLLIVGTTLENMKQYSNV